jgi:hypothetical protein
VCFVGKVFEVFYRCNELGYKKGWKGGPKGERFIYIFFKKKISLIFLFLGLKFDLFRNRWDFLLVASGGASGLLQLAVMAYSYRSLAA